MKVEVLYFEGCPNHAPAMQLARDVLSELGVEAKVEEVEVTTQEQVVERRFLGSPTMLVDGVDVEPSARGRTDFGFACRMYSGKGVPSKELVVQAMQGGRSEQGSESASPGDAHCCSTPAATPVAAEATSDGRGLKLAAMGSVVSAVAASACCWLPLLLLAFGASAAGVSGWFEQARPVLLGVSGLLLAGGFYLAYFRREACAPGSTCAVPNVRLRRLNRAMLWVASVMVLAFAFFPSYAGLLLAENSATATKESVSGLPTVTLGIAGMSCEACSVHIEKSLAEVPGVRSASVNYTEKQAKVSLDPASPPSQKALTKAIEKAGYKVTNVASR